MSRWAIFWNLLMGFAIFSATHFAFKGERWAIWALVAYSVLFWADRVLHAVEEFVDGKLREARR